MFGEVTNPKNLNLKDIDLREVAVLAPLLIFVVWIGVYPNTFLKPMEPSVKNFIQHVEKKRAAVTAMEESRKQNLPNVERISLVSSVTKIRAER